MVSAQKGVIRTNCLDSLDRTNLIQSKIAYHILGEMLEKVGIEVKRAAGSDSILVATDNIENTFIFIIHLKKFIERFIKFCVNLLFPAKDINISKFIFYSLSS